MFFAHKWFRWASQPRHGSGHRPDSFRRQLELLESRLVLYASAPAVINYGNVYENAFGIRGHSRIRTMERPSDVW
jgi:hypothetical protein